MILNLTFFFWFFYLNFWGFFVKYIRQFYFISLKDKKCQLPYIFSITHKYFTFTLIYCYSAVVFWNLFSSMSGNAVCVWCVELNKNLRTVWIYTEQTFIDWIVFDFTAVDKYENWLKHWKQLDDISFSLLV